IAAATLLVALVAPVLGALADAGGLRKKFVVGMTIIAAASTLALAAVAEGHWGTALGLYALALVGYYTANTFYDALLTDVTSPDRYETLSASAYALGYIGSATLMAVCAWMVQQPATFGLPDAATAVKATFAIVAVWWVLFMLPLALTVTERQSAVATGASIGAAYAQVFRTLRNIAGYRNVAVFLVAYWLYIDGVHTLILLAADFGARLGFSSGDLILAILLTNIVGAPATLAFGWIGRRIGTRPTIYVGVGVYILISLYGLQVTEVWQFYAMAISIGLVQGAVQSQSRALFAHLVPAERAAEFFGFYSMLGKFAAILGPLLVGIIARFSDDPRVTVFALLPLFIGGVLVLARVDVRAADPVAN
ncbi:MAG: MFS transporter, partial [Pseudomonadota bacterium]